MKPFSQPPSLRQTLDPTAEARQVALVIRTREYESLQLIEALVRNDFTAVERQGLADGFHLAEKLRPALVVLLCDPTIASELEAIATLAKGTQGFILVVAPTHQAIADALRAGADACLSDLDGDDALEAQIEAIRRRPRARPRRAPSVSTPTGPIRIDVDARRIQTPQGEAHLTDTEMAILIYLGQRPGEVVTTLELLHAVTGRVGSEVEAQHTIKVYVRRLRKKFEEVGLNPSTVANVRGRGYLLDVRARVE